MCNEIFNNFIHPQGIYRLNLSHDFTAQVKEPLDKGNVTAVQNVYNIIRQEIQEQSYEMLTRFRKSKPYIHVKAREQTKKELGWDNN
jgi:hypothetical protein